MSYLEIKGVRHAVPAGQSVIGSDPGSLITLDGAGISGRHLVIQGTPDGQAAVSRAEESASTYINGVRLGPQPTPLLHGDKIEVGDHELRFVDERRSGSTQFVRAEDLANLRAPEKPGKHATTGATGGRLVSLTDGREYTILGTPLVFGRDAGCDVVVTSKRVSRRHAEIVPTPKGYLLVDTSTNGTFVNGERIQGEQLLARADVVRIGEDDFRFYADIAREPEPVKTPAPTEPAPSAAPPAPPGAEYRLGDTMHGLPESPPPPPQPSPDKTPAGAGYKLGDTMHGLPNELVSRPKAPPVEPATPPTPPVPKTTPAVPPTGAADSPAGAPSAPMGAEYRLGDTMHGVPGSASPLGPPKPAGPGAVQAKGPPTLANLIGRTGGFRGQRFAIRVPVVNIGRASYNDVVLADSTVSTIHAKIQRREGIWVVIDLDSTNGTFVDGDRVNGEVPLAPGAIVRFGDVGTVFEPTDDAVEAEGGSSTRLMGAVDSSPEPPQADGAVREGSPLSKNEPGTGAPDGSPTGTDRDRNRQGFRIWPFK